jgi:PAS domain S-box-containing protein
VDPLGSGTSDKERDGRAPGASAEQRFRDLIEWLPAVIYEAEVGIDAEWYYVSPYVKNLLGYAAEEFMNDPRLFYSRLHPDDRDEIIELEGTEAEMARREDVTMLSEYRLLHRDGHIVWIRDQGRLVRPKGAPPYWRGVLVDITEARTAEQALAESHERYRGVVNSLPVCAYEADPHARHRRHFLSPQVRHLLGYTPGEWDADPELWERTLHPSDRSRVLRDEERHVTMAIGTPWVSEYRLLSRTGDVVWVRDRAVVAESSDGHRVIDGILTDVTAERGDSLGPNGKRDVLRLTCSSCGAIHAAEHAGPCMECGSGDVDAVSLNATLAELAAVRRQVETLLDGVHQHLETVSGGGDRSSQQPRSMPPLERRIVSRPGRGTG